MSTMNTMREMEDMYAKQVTCELCSMPNLCEICEMREAKETETLQVNATNEVIEKEVFKFELVESFKLEKLPKVEVEVKVEKGQHEWRNELTNKGFIQKGKIFEIENQTVPLRVTLADIKFISRCGNNPRIAVLREARTDDAFNAVVKKFGLKPKESCGETFEGYDFSDVRTVQELGSFIKGFEKEYRKAKFSL